MVEIEDALTYLSQNITYVITIVAVGIGIGKYVIAEIRKHADRIDKKIMGPDKDAKPGKGGAIDELRQEYKRDLAALEIKLTNKIDDTQKELIFEFQKTSMRINYMAKNFGRMEKSMERFTKGVYTADSNNKNFDDDEGFGDMDINPDGDVSPSKESSYHKKSRRI